MRHRAPEKWRRPKDTMKGSEMPSEAKRSQTKPQFRPAKDDTKPVLQDPILRSDPIETEEAVLRLPPLTFSKSKSNV